MATDQGTLPPPMAPITLQKHKKPGFFLELAVLVLRGVRNLYRDRRIVGAGVGEAVIVAFMIGAVFYQLDGGLAGIRSRGALFYTICHLQFQIMLNYNTYLRMFHLLLLSLCIKIVFSDEGVASV